MAEVFLKLEGVEKLVRALDAVPKKLREKLLKEALKRAADIVRDDAKANAPVLGETKRLSMGPVRRGFKVRTAKNRVRGLLRRAISTRSSKEDRRRGDLGMYVGVRRLKTRSVARAARADPFYWWWQEFGWMPRGPGKALRGSNRSRNQQREALAKRSSTKKVKGLKFLTGAFQKKGSQAVRSFLSESVQAIRKLDRGLI